MRRRPAPAQRSGGNSAAVVQRPWLNPEVGGARTSFESVTRIPSLDCAKIRPQGMASKLGWDMGEVMAIVLALGGGLLFARVARRLQRSGRARRLAEVDGRLRELAALMGGAFQPGPELTPYRRLLGDAREYGVARVESQSLSLEVSVIYPGEHPFEDQTSIKVRRPAGVAAMRETLRLGVAPPPDADPHAEETFVRAFPTVVPAALPGVEARRALLALAARASALELTSDELLFVATPAQALVPLASAAELRALVDEVAIAVRRAT